MICKRCNGPECDRVDRTVIPASLKWSKIDNNGHFRCAFGHLVVEVGNFGALRVGSKTAYPQTVPIWIPFPETNIVVCQHGRSTHRASVEMRRELSAPGKKPTLANKRKFFLSFRDASQGLLRSSHENSRNISERRREELGTCKTLGRLDATAVVHRGHDAIQDRWRGGAPRRILGGACRGVVPERMDY